MTTPVTARSEPNSLIGRYRYLFLPLVLLFAAITIFFPKEVSVLSGQAWLAQQAHDQLSTTLAQNTAVFATISGVKALLGVIEGSTVGVSLGASVALQLGDLVQPAYQYFDFVWDIFLYALFLVSMYQLLIDSQILTLGLLVACIGIVGIVWASKNPATTGRLRSLSLSLALFGLLVSYGIPSAILGAESITRAYVRPLRDASWNAASQQIETLTAAVNEMATVQDRLSILRPGDSVQEIMNAAQQLGQRASAIAWSTFSSLLSYISALIVELLFVPVGLVYGLRTLFRAGLSAIFS